MSVQGNIFEVQLLAMYDGPGIRTVIYLKGCPLRCLWCHNPEGMSPYPQVFYHSEKCMACGKCADNCSKAAHIISDGEHSLERELCIACGECVTYCMNSALQTVGYQVDAEDIFFKEVLIDKPFFKNDGGLTLSGGEPMLQPDFVKELFSIAKEYDINTCVETSGYCSPETIRDVADLIDLFLFDIKETDESLHKKYTGVSNKKILSNLAILDELGADVILRCPIIPELNMRKDHFEKIAILAEKSSSVKAVELEPYHPIGLAKYSALGICSKYDNKNFLEPKELFEYVRIMREHTGKPVRFSTEESI